LFRALGVDSVPEWTMSVCKTPRQWASDLRIFLATNFWQAPIVQSFNRSAARPSDVAKVIQFVKIVSLDSRLGCL
jgi:hypothetical protein